VTRVVTLLATVWAAACVTTVEREAHQAIERGEDPQPLIEVLSAIHASIDVTKRIFDVTLIEGRRRFGGEGAVRYRAHPRRLRVDVFGPRSAPVLHVSVSERDDVVVELPQEDEVLTGKLGDPSFEALTGERALVSREILGALLGSYDVGALVAEADLVAARVESERQTLYVLERDIFHSLTLESSGRRLVEYRQERDGRLVYRARFSDFRQVEERTSPWRVVVRDFSNERQFVIEVVKENDEIGDL
jgi:hypothetical protein